MSYDIDLKRKKPSSDKMAGGQNSNEMRYNDEAGADKTIKVEALMKPVGIASTSFASLPVGVQPGQMLAFFNDGNAVHYLAFDDGSGSTVAALGTGWPLRPNDYTYFIVPPGAVQYKVSAGSIGIFLVADCSYLA